MVAAAVVVLQAKIEETGKMRSAFDLRERAERSVVRNTSDSFLFCFFSLFKLRFVDSMDAELQHFNCGIGAVQTWSSLNQNYEDVLNMDSIEV